MRRILTLFLLIILYGCGGGGGNNSTASSASGGQSNPPLPSNVSLDRVEVSPAQSQLPLGLSLPFQLFAIYSNGLRLDVTSQASWVSLSPQSLSMTGNTALAVRTGQARVEATFERLSAQSQVEVTAATLSGLSIEPAQAELAAGLTQQFIAFGTFSDGSRLDVTASATWNVLDTQVAQLDASIGQVRGLRVGTTQIQASLNSLQAITTLRVTAAQLSSLEVTPINPKVPVGVGQQFQATGTFSDGTFRNVTEDCSWTSNASDRLFISDALGSKGLAGGLAVGDSQVKATLAGVSGSTQVTVTAAALRSLQLSPSNANLPKGMKQQFLAQGSFSDGSQRNLSDQVLWSSTATDVATISNLPGQSGLASGTNLGATKIRAALGGISAEVDLNVTTAVLQSLEVTPVNPGLPKGLTQQFEATGRFSDNEVRSLTSQVTWSSSNLNRASIASHGLATALTGGTTLIEARLDEVSGNTLLTITPAVLTRLTITPANPTVPKGASLALSASGLFSDNSSLSLTDSVTWTTLDSQLASISNAAGSHGLVSALLVGSTRVQAQLDGVVAETDLQVTAATAIEVTLTPTGAAVFAGSDLPLKASARLTDGSLVTITTQASWLSLTPGFANVGPNSGVVTGVARGPAQIQATYQGVSGQVLLTVGNGGLGIDALTFYSDLSFDGQQIAIRWNTGEFYWKNLVTTEMRLVSFPVDAFPGFGLISPPAISGDGQRIAFQSCSPAPSGPLTYIYLRDRRDFSLIRISENAQGEAANGASFNPRLSSDGRWVSFVSAATNLVADDSNGKDDVFLKDTQTGQIWLVSRHSNGAVGNDSSGVREEDQTPPALSADGRYVAFESLATNLVDGDSNGHADVFVHDRDSGVTEAVSLNSQGQLIYPPGATGASARQPQISGDGNLVFFQSAADLVPADNNGRIDAYVRNRQAATTSLISSNAQGVVANKGTFGPPTLPISTSADGRYLVFSSQSTNLVAGAPSGNGGINQYIKDRSTGKIDLMARKPDGQAAQSDYFGAPGVVSGDGHYLFLDGNYGTFVEGGDPAISGLIRLWNRLFTSS